jgi:hypothetical protein
MQQPRVIKIIAPAMCPHCNQEIIVNQSMVTPVIGWALKREDIMAAKARVKAEVEKAEISEEERNGYIKWLDSEETMFGPEEVQGILDEIIPKEKGGEQTKLDDFLDKPEEDKK